MAEQKWWELPGPPPSPELLDAMKEAESYGRYYRKTGREAPPDWKPGDPIPEPKYDEDDTGGAIVVEEPKRPDC